MIDFPVFFQPALERELACLDERVPAHLSAIIRGYLTSGGKRIRPRLLVRCCEAICGQGEKALPAAIAVEMFHNWTLIHDDIIDHDDFRRNNPTGHVIGARLGRESWQLPQDAADDYGVSAAILAGDSLQGRAAELLLELEGISAEARLSLVRDMTGELTQTLIYGEQVDVEMSHASWEQVTEEMVIKMMLGKTSALIKYSIQSGAVIGDNCPREKNARCGDLSQFAEYFGIAFQLQDDLLGIFGNEKTFGKPIGSDIREGKRTLMACRALKMASPAERNRLLETLGNANASQKALDDVKEIFGKVARGAIEEEIRRYAERSEDALNRALPDSPAKDDILAMTCRKLHREV